MDEIRCSACLFEESKYGKRKLKGLVQNRLNRFLKRHVYRDIPKEEGISEEDLTRPTLGSLTARFEKAYSFLEQIQEGPITHSRKNLRKMKNSSAEENLKRLEENIALVLYVNEMKYCSFN